MMGEFLRTHWWIVPPAFAAVGVVAAFLVPESHPWASAMRLWALSCGVCLCVGVVIGKALG